MACTCAASCAWSCVSVFTRASASACLAAAACPAFAWPADSAFKLRICSSAPASSFSRPASVSRNAANSFCRLALSAAAFASSVFCCSKASARACAAASFFSVACTCAASCAWSCVSVFTRASAAVCCCRICSDNPAASADFFTSSASCCCSRFCSACKASIWRPRSSQAAVFCASCSPTSRLRPACFSDSASFFFKFSISWRLSFCCFQSETSSLESISPCLVSWASAFSSSAALSRPAGLSAGSAGLAAGSADLASTAGAAGRATAGAGVSHMTGSEASPARPRPPINSSTHAAAQIPPGDNLPDNCLLFIRRLLDSSRIPSRIHLPLRTGCRSPGGKCPACAPVRVAAGNARSPHPGRSCLRPRAGAGIRSA